MDAASNFISALVRPVLAFSFAAAIVWGFSQGKVSGEAFLSVAGTVIAFYFGQRSNTDATIVGDRRKNSAPVNVEGDVNVNPVAAPQPVPTPTPPRRQPPQEK